MQEKYHKVDQVFRDQFQDFSPDFDQDSMWNEINPKRKRRPLFWMLGIAFIIISTVGFFFQRAYPNDKTPSQIIKKNSSLVHSQDPQLSVKSQNQNDIGEINVINLTPIKKTDRLENSNTETPTVSSENSAKPSASISVVYTKKDNIDINNTQIDQVKTKNENNKTSMLMLLTNNYGITHSKKRSIRPEIKQYGKTDWDKCKISKPVNMFFEIYGGGLYPIQNMDILNQERSSFAGLWDKLDTPYPGFAAGIFIGYQSSFGLYGSIGLEYQRANEKLSYKQHVEEIQIVYSDSAWYWTDGMGVDHYVGDSVISRHVYDREVQSLKKHSLINIPVNLGYSVNKRQWNIGLEVGAIINLNKHFSGKTLLLDNTFKYLEGKTAESYYSTNIGLNISSSLYISRNLGNKMVIFTKPNFRWNPTSWTNDDIGFSISNQFAGTSIGLRYYF